MLPILLLSAILLFLVSSLIAISLCVTLFWGVVGGKLPIHLPHQASPFPLKSCVTIKPPKFISNIQPGILLIPLILIFSLITTIIWALGALVWTVYAWSVKGQGPNQLLQTVPVVNSLQNTVGGITLPNGVSIGEIPASAEAIVDGASKTANSVAGSVASTVGSVNEKLGLGEKLNIKQSPLASNPLSSATKTTKIKDEPPLDPREQFAASPGRKISSSPFNPTKLSTSDVTGFERRRESFGQRRRRSSENTMVDHDDFDDVPEPPLEGMGMGWNKGRDVKEEGDGNGFLGAAGGGFDVMRSIERSLN